jgi:hypothetical protein
MREGPSLAACGARSYEHRSDGDAAGLADVVVRQVKHREHCVFAQRIGDQASRLHMPHPRQLSAVRRGAGTPCSDRE